jgi:hypothetical protein
MKKTIAKPKANIKKIKPSPNIVQIFIGMIYPKSKKMRLIMDFAICVPLIIIAGFYYSSYKVEMMKHKPGYTDKQDMGMFWSETAFHYRYAKMFADGDPNVWNTLENDKNLQYPRVLMPGKNIQLSWSLLLDGVIEYLFLTAYLSTYLLCGS